MRFCHFFFFVIYSVGVYGQSTDTSKKKIDLIHADSLEFDQSLSNAQKLKGNVQFKYKKTFMYCDSAFLYKDSNIIIANGNIRIHNDEGVRLNGDSLHYNGKEKICTVSKNVFLEEKDKKLTAPVIRYNLDSKLASYFGGGILTDKSENSTLTSKIGYYHTDDKRFFFKDSITYKHPEYVIYSDTMMHHTKSDITTFYGPTDIIYNKKTTIYCSSGYFNQRSKDCQLTGSAKILEGSQKIIGDSIIYNDLSSQGEAFRNVMVEDSAKQMRIVGHYARFNQTDSSYMITDSLLLTDYSTEDTLYLHADSLFYAFDSTQNSNLTRAFHKVKFHTPSMQGLCDSLVMAESDSLVKMFKTPVLFSDSNQLRSDSIVIKNKNNEVDTAFFYSNAFLITQLDSLKYNQIKGDKMAADFMDGDIKKMHVYSSAQTIYYPKDNEEYIGINEASSDKLNILFDEQSNVEKIVFIRPNESKLSPISASNKKKLPGFSLFFEHRPKNKKDLFSWDLNQNDNTGDKTLDLPEDSNPDTQDASSVEPAKNDD